MISQLAIVSAGINPPRPEGKRDFWAGGWWNWQHYVRQMASGRSSMFTWNCVERSNE